MKSREISLKKVRSLPFQPFCIPKFSSSVNHGGWHFWRLWATFQKIPCYTPGQNCLIKWNLITSWKLSTRRKQLWVSMVSNFKFCIFKSRPSFSLFNYNFNENIPLKIFNSVILCFLCLIHTSSNPSIFLPA